MAVTADTEVDIAAEPAAVLDVLMDVEGLPAWSPVHKKIEIIDRFDDGKPHHVKMSVSILGINDEQTVEYTWADDKVVWDLVEGSQQKSQHGEYTLTPTDKGTHVTFSLTVDPKIPIPGFLVKKGTKTILAAATEGLRQQVVG
ncbi:cyclase [Rhodococcus sp. RS1C4]|uniref:SRPBCC family protein n=1 Tax=Nocardiaceae TaxID=85025 RepID=UPI000382254E|nr:MULTISPECIES: SRPBCC family protein [Rhodococcus]OZC55386.1 cyclase [Rhodococcus sp. 06-621-2]OZC58294.1 cyclase [Rhodococcus sp. RS1C4]OZC88129.1 cyclase [Rhodococcus sp. 06-418-1B]OZD11700.1 cyclase [Rhodococcus sp. 06-156-4C]OZD15543.1 cyclase [Rhodococcus sp. 06-156-4a]